MSRKNKMKKNKKIYLYLIVSGFIAALFIIFLVTRIEFKRHVEKMLQEKVSTAISCQNSSIDKVSCTVPKHVLQELIPPGISYGSNQIEDVNIVVPYNIVDIFTDRFRGEIAFRHFPLPGRESIEGVVVFDKSPEQIALFFYGENEVEGIYAYTLVKEVHHNPPKIIHIDSTYGKDGIKLTLPYEFKIIENAYITLVKDPNKFMNVMYQTYKRHYEHEKNKKSINSEILGNDYNGKLVSPKEFHHRISSVIKKYWEKDIKDSSLAPLFSNIYMAYESKHNSYMNIDMVKKGKEPLGITHLQYLLSFNPQKVSEEKNKRYVKCRGYASIPVMEFTNLKRDNYEYSISYGRNIIKKMLKCSYETQSVK